jgi:hypothetical protein
MKLNNTLIENVAINLHFLKFTQINGRKEHFSCQYRLLQESLSHQQDTDEIYQVLHSILMV